MKRKLVIIAGVWALMVIELANAEEALERAWHDKIEFHGDITAFYDFQDDLYFTDDLEASFVEPTLRLGANIHLAKWIDLNLRGAFTAVAGGSMDLTFAEDEIETVLDLWNVELKELFDQPLSVKLGRQEVGFGDGFLIYDGVAEEAAVLSTPLRSFYAAMVTYAPEPFTFDLFAALTEGDYVVYDGFINSFKGRSRFFGGNAHLEKEDIGIWDVLVFYRDDTSDLKNDTLSMSLRGEYAIPFFPLLTLSGEIVKQYGNTKLNRGVLSDTTQNRDAWGGHVDATLSLEEIRFSPYIKGSFISLSGDDPDTYEVESYDPMFFGWNDWGKWWIGSIASWELVTTNENVLMIEAGINPTQSTKLRVQLFDFRLDEEIIAGAGREWSREANVIFDWYPTEKIYTGVEFGYAHPRKAAKAFNGANENTVEVSAWVGVSF